MFCKLIFHKCVFLTLLTVGGKSSTLLKLHRLAYSFKIAYLHVLLRDLLCLPAQSPEHKGDFRRQECYLSRAGEGRRSSSTNQLVRVGTDFMMVAWGARCPVLFTDESRLTGIPCNRRERVKGRQGESYTACNMVQRDKFGSGQSLIWGGLFMEARKDPYWLGNGNMTAIRYWNEILEPNSDPR